MVPTTEFGRRSAIVRNLNNIIRSKMIKFCLEEGASQNLKGWLRHCFCIKRHRPILKITVKASALLKYLTEELFFLIVIFYHVRFRYIGRISDQFTSTSVNIWLNLVSTCSWSKLSRAWNETLPLVLILLSGVCRQNNAKIYVSSSSSACSSASSLGAATMPPSRADNTPTNTGNSTSHHI